MSIFAKACAKVLLEMPAVNAFIDGDDLIYHDYADVSIAISTPEWISRAAYKKCREFEISRSGTQIERPCRKSA